MSENDPAEHDPAAELQTLLEIRDFLQDVVGGAAITDNSRNAAAEFVSFLDARFGETWHTGVVAETGSLRPTEVIDRALDLRDFFAAHGASAEWARIGGLLAMEGYVIGRAGPEPTDPLAGLDERLDRLFLSDDRGVRFVLSTDSARNIVAIVREWLRTRTSTGRTTPEPPHARAGLDDGARYLARWIGYLWDGLREDRIVDRGFQPWAFNGIGQKHFQGGKEDLRDAVRAILQRTGARLPESPDAAARRFAAAAPAKRCPVCSMDEPDDEAGICARGDCPWPVPAPTREAAQCAPSELLDLATEFEGEAKAHTALGDRDESTKCLRAAYALRRLAAGRSPAR